MSSFDDRKKGQEAKFARDAELRFKAESRRNRHLANWASDQFGVTDPDARLDYIAEIIAADMAEAGIEDIVRKLVTDFEAQGVATDEAAIRAKIAEFDAQAQQEVLTEG